MSNPYDYNPVLDFWFVESTPEDWFAVSTDFDALIHARFADVYAAAAAGELWKWRKKPEGRLAEIIVLDQFSRNLFRNDPRAFAHDTMALALAQEAVSIGADAFLPEARRHFLYMPYMHSESAAIHVEALRLFTLLGNDNALDYEHKHKVIIDRFGRYPHRNKVLGRESTAEEEAFLTQPGSSF
ncbi:MAG: DUF924 domain-containing protein [Alphaproteobacteria bacterium]|nr:DUF924 domain-containing protein [Alphaproteobacteria bacterium]